MMNKKELLKKIIQGAKRDEKNRRDLRYQKIMGFLVAKGFLHTNQPIRLAPNQRIQINDAIWAGKNVEPRILEVLPAAVLRLPRHFDLDPKVHTALVDTIERLRKQEEQGPDFLDMPYKKIKIWVDLELKDGRIKSISERKITKTFRFKPKVVAILRELSLKTGYTETETLERLVAGTKIV